jgi:hypothetical protein
MRFNEQQLVKIFQRTSGYCHICHKKLQLNKYGAEGERGSWEVEHSNPQAKGGTHRLNNLYPACIRCNRAKGARSTRSARAKHGKTRAPLSVAKRRKAKAINALKGAVLGGVTGIFITIDVTGVLVVIGVLVGYWRNPDHD